MHKLPCCGYFLKTYHRIQTWRNLIKRKKKLKNMEIPLGIGMVEPIYIPCKQKLKKKKKKFWSGTIKLHLLNPTINGINLLKDSRPFIQIFDDKTTLDEVCKTCNFIA